MRGEKIVVLASATVVALGAYYFLFSSKNKEKKNNTTKTKALVSSPSVCVDPVATSKDALKKAIESLNEQYPNLLKRKFFNSRMFNPVAVRFLQFNMLAEGLSSEPDFGGFVKCPREALDFHKFRKFRVLEEILRYEADIVAVEECDHFHDFFLPALKLYGYDGKYFPKRNSKANDGVAILWKTKVIALKDIDHVYYNSDGVEPGAEWSQVGVIGRFERGHCGRTFLVAATHLKAKKSVENEKRRVSQLKQLLGKLQAMKRENEHIVVMGDFNTSPSVDYFDEQCTYDMITSHPLNLKSAYKCNGGTEPEYTTCKVRKNGEACHTIDYIFIPNDAVSLSNLEIPDISSLPESRLPGFCYPSDHLAIGCDVLF
jgi:nocturnin